MDDDDDFFGPVVQESPQSRRFMRTDVAVLALDLVQGVVAAAAETLMAARNVAAFHANWQYDQDRFRQMAVLDIETMISGDAEDG